MITTTISSSINVKPRAFTALPSGRERASIRKARNRRPYCGPCPPFLQEACLTLRVDPILSSAYSYDEGHPQIGHPLHLAFYKGSGIRPFALWGLKYQLIMHLEEHSGPEICRFKCGVDPDHRDLVEPGAYTGESLEVVLDEGLRLVERDAQLPRQRQCPLTVDRREVDGFGARAHLARHVFLRHVENDGR